ncbi:uncharacterized protein [Prorops nasuta]|uniref:uncharacterized protein n=1 Tax=Prorops nasuta TaxID=863751 RepID=UPI0034CFBD27
MATMGVRVFCNRVQINGNEEQLMLLRTLQDNERNIIGNEGQLVVTKNNWNNINSTSNSTLPPYDPSRLKKHGKNGQPPPVAVARRNARERNRVKQVNNGFATLRQHIPSHIAAGYGERGKKLSKVETLRMAVEYIRGLQRLLAEADADNDTDGDADPDVESSTRVKYETITDTSEIGTVENRCAPSPANSLLSSSHNGSAEGLLLDDENGNRAISPTQENNQHSSRRVKVTRHSPSRTSDYYASSIGDEENLEPLPTVKISNALNYASNEENLDPRVLSPYSGTGDSEEGADSFGADGHTVYYKQELADTPGEFMDVVNWWEQEQGRLVHHVHQQQRLAHV